MTKFIFIALALSISLSSFSACELPKGQRLKIGCAYGCDFIYRFRLFLSSMSSGYPIKVVNMRSMKNMTEALNSVDGILIPGGADIDPEFYLDDVTPELQKYTRENLSLVNFSQEGKYRDQYEHDLVQRYSTDERYENLPMLGICRGMQMMSVVQGIPLYLDIKTELGIRNRQKVFDRISINKQEENNTLMEKLFGDNPFKGFKLHHQGVRMDYYREHKATYPLTKITAVSNDGKIAEAIEYLHRPALGVQYHPEKSLQRASQPVFEWLFEKACEYKLSKKD